MKFDKKKWRVIFALKTFHRNLSNLSMKQSTLSTFFKSALAQSATPVENGSSLINVEVNQNLDSIQSTQPNKEIKIEESLLTFPIGTKIMKPFPPDNQYYGGEIVEYDEMEKWYKVIYDDGDVEDLDHYEVLKYLTANQDSFSKKNNSIPQKRRNKSIDCSNNRKECHSVNTRITKTRQSSSLEKLENLSDNESVSKMTSSGKRGRSKNVSFAKFYDSESSSKLEDWDDDSFDDNCQILSKESSEHQNKRSRLLAPSKSSHVATLGIMNGRKNTKATTKPVQSSSKSTSKSESKLPKKGSDSKVQGSTEKKKMSECFEPKNYPDYQKLSLKQIKEEKEFLDPCGMEATDGIIDRLVGEQVDKIGSLLARSLSSDLGSLATSLKLGTACSGTDAPALALTLIKEQMELRKLQPLNFVHCFSCEVDPFKQAYIARNFDSILYPDISKLHEDPPRDVYGQEQPIPEFNLFVAGTSCKNFSMLRSNKRLDIEDRGCSGETFIAATELLFKEKPKMAIFENVEGAPWEKMSEYITGRVKLSECDKSKAIKNIKDKNKGLSFVKEENGDIVVDYVPAVYGIRCGAIIDGFLKGTSTKLQQVAWPSGSKKSCTLNELMTKNKISKAHDTLVFKTDVIYCTQICKTDTKDYGLPQTRNRVYMFVWQPEKGNVADDLGIYWKAVVEYLKSPVRHSLPSFVLNVDHEIIRTFREALNGPPGRKTKLANFLEPDFWTSASANLPHNVNARAKLGLKDTARFTTSWGAHGKKQVPPHFWLEYMNCNNQRILDLIDILHASAARDAESHDSYFTSFYWNISQNASKEKHRTATPGIAGCVTPGGDFFVPSEGRPLLGCEKLLLQGIPYFRLALGNETEVQLGDLAGNAMSLTVVCAAMMGAITCRQLRNELQGSLSLDSIGQHLGKKCALDSYTKSCRWNGSVICSKHESNISYYDCDNKFFSDLAHLAKEAVDSSLWCTCETSGSMSNATSFLECTRCRISCCRNCTGTTAGYNLDGHEMVEVHLCYQVHACCDMQLKLRSIAPSSLMISKEGFQEIASLQGDRARVSGLHDLEFQLHRLKRNRRKWDIIYYARDNNGIGENLAEFKISVGEIERKERGATLLGVTAELKSFLPAKTEPLHYGIIVPCARFTMSSECSQGIWMGKSSNTSVKTNVVGIGFTDSNRVEVGLSDDAEMALLDHISKARVEKDFEASKRRGEERRWIYAKNWKVWPEKIVIDEISSHDGNLHVDGEYIRCHCRRTINQGALWMKSGSDASPSLFLLLRPNVFRTGPDTAIISTSSNYEDTLSVIAEFPFKWEPCDSLDKGKHCQELIFQGMKNLQRITCLIPKSELSVTSKGEDKDTLLILRGLSKSEIQMFRRESDLSGKFRLNVSSGPQAQHIVRVFNTICVPRILKHAATFGIKLDLSPHANWEYLQPSNKSIPFGTCKTTIPDPPRETWYFCDERKSWERSSEPGASRAYYLALQAAPTPFEIWLDTDERAIEVKFFPEVVAHNAAGQLIRGRGNIDFTKEVKVYYRLSDISQQSDPITTLFKVHNCNEFPAKNVPLKSTYSLYERQQKVVSKMLAIEDKQTTFEELEMSEFEMPGSSGFSLAAKAVRETTICGGVIADAIGAGKTVISIALILQDIEKSRRERALPNKSSATLVAVPPGLIDQWHAEVKKFSDYLTVVKIYDFSSMLKVKLSDMIAADIVIINVDILQSEGYLENLLKKAGLANEVKNLPCLPQYAGQIEQTQARGVWIPSTSNDPYGGANNPNNQKRRNHTAFYTTIYNKGVLALREKSFNDFDRGIPIEYFEYHRIIVDEIHESLCTTRNELKSEKETADRENGSFYKEKNRRAARELLGITEKDIRKRPLTCRKAIFGLTGTPLLDSSGRIIELANLMGGTYIIGLSSHWRKLERESCRDIFLHNYLEPRQSREIRKNINLKCQAFLDTACTRNKADEEMEGINLFDHRRVIRMSQAEKKAYLQSQSGISAANKSLSIKPEDFDPSAGHDISKFLRQNANLACRGEMLITICKEILQKDPETKIVVFADGRIEAGISARNCLIESGLGCTWLDKHDSVQEKNKKIAWYQSADATAEDHKRPRVLVLNFAHAAGLNLQKECYNLILYTPLYVGEGGSSGDPVADASTELQAIGRVYRPGQSHPTVNLFRIEVQGPEGEECLDGMLIRRNTDPDTKAMAINASD